MVDEGGELTTLTTESELDAQFTALADAQRRRLLVYLLEEHPAAVSRTAAVAHVASTTEQEYERVETKMLHQHLPQLEDSGLVSYDSEDEELAYISGEFVEDILKSL